MLIPDLNKLILCCLNNWLALSNSRIMPAIEIIAIVNFMKFLLSTNDIPALSEYSNQERQQILAIAQQLLTPFERFQLNLLKLFILVPAFFGLARLEGLAIAAVISAAIFAYLIIMRPISLTFCSRHLDKAIKKFTVE